MRVGTIIPIHSFLAQAEATVNWCIENYPKLFDDYKIVIVSDSMLPRVADLFSSLANKRNSVCMYSGRKDSLKHSLIKGLEQLKGFDVIHIIEADAIPDFKVLAAMLEAYENLESVGGVCPMFQWKGKDCYPTHRHWYTDPLVTENFMRSGQIREVGKPGIPFLFSLWNPKAIGTIKRHCEQLPDVYSLDGKLGSMLYKDFRFIRTSSHAIQHINGGKNK